jgi:3-oxoacyl-[acyl-carrier-protein] synthase II
MKRVVITGLGAVSPYGRGVDTLVGSLIEGKSGIRRVEELAKIRGLNCRVAGLAPDIDPREIPRKYRRSMSNMSIFAVLACQEALRQAGLGTKECAGGHMGVAIGSTTGSIQATQEFFENFFSTGGLEQMKSTIFFKIMNHSCAANISKVFGLTGRILSPSAACSTSCQAIGYGYEMIAFGRQRYMLCGGADEFHALTAGTFDVLNAASVKYNEQPHRTPRPFDRDRDGVVCSEGSGIILLESLDSAQKRGVPILGEIIGFATVSDPNSIANPDVDFIELCMRKALNDAGIEPRQIDYINAHATATVQGDLAESEAIFRLFGNNVPVSSFKGHLGHALAASGALELCGVVGMLNRQCMIPTLNLDNVDELCKNIRHVKSLRTENLQTVMKNNFALGGINSSLVIRRYQNG